MEGVAALSGIRLVTLDAGTGRLQPTGEPGLSLAEIRAVVEKQN